VREKEALQHQLALAKQLLNYLHEEEAVYGSLNVPDYLKLKIAEQEREIVGIGARLAKLDRLEQESRLRPRLQHYISGILAKELNSPNWAKGYRSPKHY
jgi:hypothetical protein